MRFLQYIFHIYTYKLYTRVVGSNDIYIYIYGLNFTFSQFPQLIVLPIYLTQWEQNAKENGIQRDYQKGLVTFFSNNSFQLISPTIIYYYLF